MENPSLVVCTYNPSTGKTETGLFWGSLAGQSSLGAELQAIRGFVSKEEGGVSEDDIQGVPLATTHMCT